MAQKRWQCDRWSRTGGINPGPPSANYPPRPKVFLAIAPAGSLHSVLVWGYACGLVDTYVATTSLGSGLESTYVL